LDAYEFNAICDILVEDNLPEELKYKGPAAPIAGVQAVARMMERNDRSILRGRP
jgi:hypothetical protein